MEVIYTGLRQTPEQIVNGRSAGGRRCDRVVDPEPEPTCTFVRASWSCFTNRGLDDVIVVVGGIIPDVDISKLKDIGIAGIFLPGTPMQDIVEFINARVQPRSETV